MKDLIKKFDFNDSRIDLYYNGKNGIKTIAGGVITFFLLIILALLVFGFGQDFFYRLNPLLIIQDLNPTDYKKFNISNDNFPFAFRFEDNLGNKIDPEQKHFYFNLFYGRSQRINGELETLEYRNLNYISCNSNFTKNKDLFESKGLSEMYCIDYEDKGFLEFGGNWDGSFISYIYIDIMKCPEGEVNNKNEDCGPNSITEDIFGNLIYISTYLPFQVVDPTNYTNPLSLDMKIEYSLLDKNLVKNYVLSFEEILIESEIGWLMENKIIESSMTYKEQKVDYSLSSSLSSDEYNKNMLGSISLAMNRKIEKYKRIYSKIQSLIADVGGIMKVFTFILALCIRKYNISKLNFDLLNIVNSFQSDEEIIKNNNNHIKQNDQSIVKINNFTVKKTSKNIKLNQPSEKSANIELREEYKSTILHSAELINKELKELKDVDRFLNRIKNIETQIIPITKINQTIKKFSNKTNTNENKNTIKLVFFDYFYTELKNTVCSNKKFDFLKNKMTHLLDVQIILENNYKLNRFFNVFFEENERNALFFKY